MSKEFRDPLSEYEACKAAEKLIGDKLSLVSSSGAIDSPEVQQQVQKLSMTLVEVREVKERARKQYNDHIKQTDSFIQKAKDAKDVLESTYYIACALENVFQSEPLEDTDES
jgi:hypothetical protein